MRRLMLGAAATLAVGVLLLGSTTIRVGTQFMAARVKADIRDAHCVTADAPVLLIETDRLRDVLERGCPLFVDPTGISYDTDLNLTGAARRRRHQVEYQQIMANYYGSSDAALFMRLRNDAFSHATWAMIKAHLPTEVKRGTVLVRLPR